MWTFLGRTNVRNRDIVSRMGIRVLAVGVWTVCRPGTLGALFDGRGSRLHGCWMGMAPSPSSQETPTLAIDGN